MKAILKMGRKASYIIPSNYAYDRRILTAAGPAEDYSKQQYTYSRDDDRLRLWSLIVP